MRRMFAGTLNERGRVELVGQSLFRGIEDTSFGKTDAAQD